jgi:hypothetical protein
MVADLLHTLGQVGLTPHRPTTILTGTISSKAQPGLERYAAKILLEGTNVSTLADLSGHYEIRDLPPGTYQVIASRPGNGFARATVSLVGGETNLCDVTLSQSGANLIRNGDFKLQWVQAGAPDSWFPTKLGLEGEIIPLQNGQPYHLRATFKEGAKGDVLVRWTKLMPYQVPKPEDLPKIESTPLTPEKNELTFTGTDQMAFVQVTVRSKSPESVCESIVLKPVTER